jgi:LytS/YehU family sensor histidine kinase
LVSVEKRSVFDIENEVRTAMLKNSFVKAVSKVTVHYIDNALLSIEAAISVDDSLTLSVAKKVSKRLREELLQSSGIHHLDIYIDSNSHTDMVDRTNARFNSERENITAEENISSSFAQSAISQKKFYGIGKKDWKRQIFRT